MKAQGNLKLNDCSVLESLVINGGQATFVNIFLFFNSSANSKKAEIVRGAKASFSNSSLQWLCQVEDASAKFSANSYVDNLSLKNSTVVLINKSLTKHMLMDNSHTNFFSGSSVWQQPTVLTNSSTLTIHSDNKNNLSFFQSIILNDSSRLSCTGVGGTWQNSRANILSEGITVNSPNAGIEWIFQSEADIKSSKIKPVIPYITDLPVKIGHINLGYSVMFSYVQHYKDPTKKTDFSKLLNLFKATPAQGIILAELQPNSILPTNFVLQALTDYSEDPVTHALSYKVNPKTFNSLIKDDQGKQYQFGCKILIAPLCICLTIEKC